LERSSEASLPSRFAEAPETAPERERARAVPSSESSRTPAVGVLKIASKYLMPHARFNPRFEEKRLWIN
jgi:hypothetical protein